MGGSPEETPNKTLPIHSPSGPALTFRRIAPAITRLPPRDEVDINTEAVRQPAHPSPAESRHAVRPGEPLHVDLGLEQGTLLPPHDMPVTSATTANLEPRHQANVQHPPSKVKGETKGKQFDPSRKKGIARKTKSTKKGASTKPHAGSSGDVESQTISPMRRVSKRMKVQTGSRTTKSELEESHSEH